jgi:hypothetical protein
MVAAGSGGSARRMSLAKAWGDTHHAEALASAARIGAVDCLALAWKWGAGDGREEAALRAAAHCEPTALFLLHQWAEEEGRPLQNLDAIYSATAPRERWFYCTADIQRERRRERCAELAKSWIGGAPRAGGPSRPDVGNSRRAVRQE